ncbi:MAG: HEPN domain-containing protein [Promethearchaeota archaeon]|nr:MAG: HEPN domain-containing protein [Candidatus Lokiarchaeota archaeon]
MKNQLVEEWLKRGKRDLETAKILFSSSDYFDIILFHIHQAVEKYIKGFLISRGWMLQKIHDLEVLITEAIKFDDFFMKHLDFGRKLTGFYFEERYPPGPVSTYSKEEIKKVLNIAEMFGKSKSL